MPAATSVPAHVPLAAATRGGALESIHFGSVAVTDRSGRMLFAAGDPEAMTFTRSALKPVQALPFVAGGGVERFGLSAPQVALLCASHSGESRHVEAVADILAKCRSSPDDLRCGTHAPGFYEARGEVPPPPPYSALAHNCSGKHSGMLAWCEQWGASKADYLAFEHPLQRAIRHAIAAFCGVAEAALLPGIDGCSAPNYAMPLYRLAQAYARLASPEPDSEFGTAPQRLAAAMAAHPEMVSGERRSDLALAHAGRGDWVAKIGAEGVQAIGVRSLRLGIAVKIADGQRRGIAPVVVAILAQLGLLDAEARRALARWAQPTLTNYAGTITGDVRPLVVLDKH
jgi:L-asparaginase II